MTASVSKCETRRNEEKKNVRVFLLRMSIREFAHPLSKILTGLWNDPPSPPPRGRLWLWWGSWWFSAFWPRRPHPCSHLEADGEGLLLLSGASNKDLRNVGRGGQRAWTEPCGMVRLTEWSGFTCLPAALGGAGLHQRRLLLTSLFLATEAQQRWKRLPAV